jgi:hypothetical protein
MAAPTSTVSRTPIEPASTMPSGDRQMENSQSTEEAARIRAKQPLAGQGQVE